MLTARPLLSGSGMPRLVRQNVMQAPYLFVSPQRFVNGSQRFERIVAPRERLPLSLEEGRQEVLIGE